MRNKMRSEFLHYDQQKMIDKFHLDHDATYLYLTFLYGFVGWRTPAAISLISSRRDLLAAFFGEFMKTLEEKTRKWGAEADEKAETE